MAVLDRFARVWPADMRVAAIWLAFLGGASFARFAQETTPVPPKSNAEVGLDARATPSTEDGLAYFTRESQWNPERLNAALPWFPMGSYSGAMRSRWNEVSAEELGQAKAYVAALLAESRGGDLDTTQLQEWALKNHPSLVNAAAVRRANSQTSGETFTLGVWGFHQEIEKQFEGGLAFWSARNWSEEILTKVETRYSLSADSESDPEPYRLAEIDHAEGPEHEHYRGVLDVCWRFIQRARLILAILSPDQAVEGVTGAEGARSQLLFHRMVRSEEPAWKALGFALESMGLLTGNGELFLEGSSMECWLVLEGKKLAWKEIWREPGERMLLERRITWQGGVPSTTLERRHIVGTQFLYYEVSAGIQPSDQPDPSIRPLPSLEGMSVYDYRTDPPIITHPR